MSTYFILDPFEFPYYFYRIRRVGGGLIYVLSIDPPLMMAKSRAESTRDTYNYEICINEEMLPKYIYIHGLFSKHNKVK